jgi:sugar phosphate isomerase/epimerase
MKPCVSQACTMPASFAEDLDAYAAAGIAAVEVWLTKLETALESRSPGDLKKQLEDTSIALVAASYQGGLLLSQGEQRRAHFDHFKRRLDLCQHFGIGTMLVVADFAQKPSATDFERAIVSLKQAAQWAAGFGVRLALEFRGGDAFCSCLETALMLVEHCREPNVGVNLDVFHYYKGPSKPEDLERLTKHNLAFVQVCDVSGVPRELMTDSDRILPGEGDFRLEPMIARLREIGYDGYLSLEVLNPTIWQAKANQVAELGRSALNRLLSKP